MCVCVCVCVCVWNLEMSSLKTARPIFTRIHMGPNVEGVLSIYSSGAALLNKWLPCPYMVNKKQTFKNLLPLWGWIGRKVNQVCSNDDPRMTFDLYTTWSNFCPSCSGNTARMLHGIFKHANATEVSESWPMGLLFSFIEKWMFFITKQKQENKM